MMLSKEEEEKESIWSNVDHWSSLLKPANILDYNSHICSLLETSNQDYANHIGCCVICISSCFIHLIFHSYRQSKLVGLSLSFWANKHVKNFLMKLKKQEKLIMEMLRV